MRSLEAIKVCFFLVSLVCLFGASTAIECYECNSGYDPRCGDPFDPYSLGKVNCSLKPRLEHMPNLEPTICRKTSQKIFGKMRVIRECGYIASEYDNQLCLRRTGTFEVQNFFCSCTSDLCNAAPISKHSSLIAIAVLFMLIAMLQLQ